MSVWPGVAGSGLPLLASMRSAAVLIGVISVSWLLSGLGSGVGLLTEAVLTTVPAAEGFTWPRSHMVRAAPAGSVPKAVDPVQG